jgi:hypothetical protein
VRVRLSANGSGVELSPLPDWNGEGFFVLGANDSEYETEANITVIVNPVDDPPVFLSIQDEWIFTEDSLGSYEFRAQDRADRDIELAAQTDIQSVVLGLGRGINRSVEADGEVHFTISMLADNRMVGIYSCNVTVSDSDGGNRTVPLAVRIVNVNDPPMVAISAPLEGQIFEHNRTISLSADASDDDFVHGDFLRFDWRADGSVALGTRQNLTKISLMPGNHTITLTAKDSSGAASRAMVNITVLDKPAVEPPIDDNQTHPAPPEGLKPSPLWAAAVAVAAVAAAAVIVLVVRRKR